MLRAIRIHPSNRSAIERKDIFAIAHGEQTFIGRNRRRRIVERQQVEIDSVVVQAYFIDAGGLVACVSQGLLCKRYSPGRDDGVACYGMLEAYRLHPVYRTGKTVRRWRDKR